IDYSGSRYSLPKSPTNIIENYAPLLDSRASDYRRLQCDRLFAVVIVTYPALTRDCDLPTSTIFQLQPSCYVAMSIILARSPAVTHDAMPQQLDRDQLRLSFQFRSVIKRFVAQQATTKG